MHFPETFWCLRADMVAGGTMSRGHTLDRSNKIFIKIPMIFSTETEKPFLKLLGNCEALHPAKTRWKRK
jgi:hypothetical protein